MEAFLAQQSVIILAVVFVGALIVLARSTDLLIDHSVSLSKGFGVSEVVIGATIVSLGTTLPEFATSIISVLQGSADVAVGNAVGSVITNTTLILGVGAFAGAIPVSRTVSRRVFFLVACGLLLVVGGIHSFTPDFFQHNGHISRVIGIIFLVLLPIYLYLSFSQKKDLPLDDGKKKVKEKISGKKALKEVVIIFISAVTVALSATLIVATVKITASRMGISEAIISSTIVALGTSLPELSTTVSATRKGFGSLALGNVIGANIMNILLVLGTSIALSPGGLPVSAVFFQLQYPIMLLVLGILAYFIFNTKKHEIVFKEGLLLLSIYVVYLALNTMQ